jgi:hypothetical protein
MVMYASNGTSKVEKEKVQKEEKERGFEKDDARTSARVKYQLIGA